MAKGQDPVAALWEALATPYALPPAGSITYRDYSKNFGLSLRQSRDRLTAAVAGGKLESGEFIVAGHKTRHYWLPKKKGKK